MNNPFFIILIISSPEPLGSQSELIVFPSSRRPSVRRTSSVGVHHFSSPESKAHKVLIIYQSSCRLCVCLCVNIFKLEYLRNQSDNRNEILSEPSLGWGKGRIRFWVRSDQNSGFHGNG